MNAAWGRSFAAWSDVHVPRPREAAVRVYDWRQFVAVKLQEDLQVSCGCIRTERSPRRSRATAISPARARSVADDGRRRSLRNVVYDADRRRPRACSPRSIRCAPAVVTNRGGSGRYPSGRAAANVSGTTASAGPLRLWAWQPSRAVPPRSALIRWRVSSAISVTDGRSLDRVRAAGGDGRRRRSEQFPLCTAAPASFQDRDPVESDRNDRFSHERVSGAVRHEYPG